MTLPAPWPGLPIACRDRDDVVLIALAVTPLRAAAPVPIVSADTLRPPPPGPT